jgi:hypothetical protein
MRAFNPCSLHLDDELTSPSYEIQRNDVPLDRYSRLRYTRYVWRVRLRTGSDAHRFDGVHGHVALRIAS